MRNFERLNSLMGAEPIDEQAVGMLLNHISQEIGSSWIESHVEHYIRLYKTMKNWLNSEVGNEKMQEKTLQTREMPRF